MYKYLLVYGDIGGVIISIFDVFWLRSFDFVLISSFAFISLFCIELTELPVKWIKNLTSLTNKTLFYTYIHMLGDTWIHFYYYYFFS